jgi:hypothetical protein
VTGLIIICVVMTLVIVAAVYGLFVSGKRDDISSTSETGGWMG